MFNVRIGGARRCAAQSYSTERARRQEGGRSQLVNDAVLAMCSGALRYYLIEQNALPDAPLVAMIPISLRSKEEADAGGDLVGDILQPRHRYRGSGGADGSDQRLDARQQGGLQTVAARAGAGVIGTEHGSADAGACPGCRLVYPAPFNLVISNVPGLAEPMYYGGARVDGSYPLSALPEGQALNITLVNNVGNLDFGLVGCRRSVPHLQRLLAHLESSLKDLEAAVGI